MYTDRTLLELQLQTYCLLLQGYGDRHDHFVAKYIKPKASDMTHWCFLYWVSHNNTDVKLKMSHGDNAGMILWIITLVGIMIFLYTSEFSVSIN